MDAFWEGNRLQTAPPASRGWVYQYTVREKTIYRDAVRVLCQQVFYSDTMIFFKVSCLFSGHYLPSWVPIHTVPAVSPDIRQERLCQKEEPSKHCYSQNVFSKLSVLSEGILRTQNISENLFLGSCCSLLYRHWPTGGTAQMQRAGAVGGRLNWSRTVLDRAGSITVISLLKAGPETTHTEHWHKSDGYGVWKDEWHETTRPR